MPRPRRPIIGGNWKMNTTRASAVALAAAVCDAVEATPPQQRPDVAVFPPFPYLLPVGEVLRTRNSPVLLGAQDVYPAPSGAFTGEVSVEMLIDCGVSVVLAGHSERRHIVGENDALINIKVRAILDRGLSCVLCIGETEAQRQAGRTNRVNQRQRRAALAGVAPDQMARVIIAYEPVWAIGTGKNATPTDAQDAHSRIRAALREMYGPDIAASTRIQYGGSVKAANAADLMAMPDVDGFLVGGASLIADEFAKIMRASAAAA